MKRIIVILCAVSLLITFMIIPAAATENDAAYQPSFEDLLDLAVEYEMQAYKNGSLLVTQWMKDPIVQVNTSGYVIHFIWGDEYSRSYYDYILVGLQIEDRPEEVKLNNIAATFLGQTDGICYYKVPFGQTSLAKYDLMVDIHILGGELKIVSCYGVTDDSIGISSANLKVWGQLRSDGQYFMQTFFNDSVSVPYTYQREFYETSPSVTPDSLYLELAIPISLAYADSLSISFFSPSIFPNDSNSFSLSGSSGVALKVDGNTVQALSYLVSHVTASSSYMGQAQYLQTVTIDLTGVDLSGDTEIIFRFYMSSSPVGYVAGGGSFYRFQIMKIGIKQDLYSKPWYMRLFYWIDKALIQFRSNMDFKIDQVITAIRESLGVGQAVPDISDQQQQIQDDVGGMDQIGGEMEDSREEMEELLPEMPSWEDTGLDGFDTIVGSYIQQIEVFFTAIYENVILSQILTYTFLFALGGFILFGERM